MVDISRNATVEKSAKLAEDVRVGPFSYIGPHVKIGRGCVIENNVTIVGKTTLGARTHVFPMAVVGAANGGEEGECIIGNANAIREHVTIYAGAANPTRIGHDNLIMIGSHVGAGATVGDHGIFANCTSIGPEAAVEDYVRTSGFCAIEAGVTVGAYTFIAGYAGINHDAPPFAMVHGFPMRVRGVNRENLRRCGFGDDDIRALKAAFRELFSDTSDQPDASVLNKLAKSASANAHVRRLVEFLRRHPVPEKED